ncbi:hypothetical protein A2713_00780 [candidate division WWE3 bacterium RIFCSPHIGHO2_01_FULL_35_17]|uniref:Uncharacterized protein n=1 Tax=candidate division WWE3 bacterium RIFCSPHIGHO2_01_FULL_35_17 TaxID=1802614 RepID=A0A1F4UQZ3_UNCKA|nr:MAG: hypothetical protein A2713_00780 [candidate division WWE3 bacterium RIFCSPHIGHO2_01_FULL_35_17]
MGDVAPLSYEAEFNSLNAFTALANKIDELNRDPIYEGLRHAEFVGVPEVYNTLLRLGELLFDLSDSQTDPLLKRYYEQMVYNLPYITGPDSDVEKTYYQLVSAMNLPVTVVRFALAMFGYKYWIQDPNSDRCDAIFAIGELVKRYEIPSGFIDYLKKFFNVDDNFSVVVVDENLLVLGGSQGARRDIFGQTPSGSSHVSDSPDGSGNKCVVIRKYTNVVPEKIEKALACGEMLFTDSFWKSNGFDTNNRYDRFVNGQHVDLMAHETSEAVVTGKILGSDKPMQECLATTAGFTSLVYLHGINKLSLDDLLDARIYLLSKIVMTVAANTLGVYTPGYAFMLKRLLDNKAFSMIDDGQINSVNWEIFDSTMESIAVELRDELYKDPYPTPNLQDRVVNVREHPIIQQFSYT